MASEKKVARKSRINYTKDFTRRGSFSSFGRDLVHNVYPGVYDGSKWSHSARTEDETALLILKYINKNTISIIYRDKVGIHWPGEESAHHLVKSFDFLQKAESKFNLKGGTEVPLGWHHQMPIRKAQELLAFLKIQVIFPN